MLKVYALYTPVSRSKNPGSSGVYYRTITNVGAELTYVMSQSEFASSGERHVKDWMSGVLKEGLWRSWMFAA